MSNEGKVNTSLSSYTVTCHRPINYGAVLQAYALNTKLCSYGVNAKVLDYHPSYYYHKNIFKYLLRLPDVILGRKRFNKFISSHIPVSESMYKNIDDIKKNTPVADIYITGSDQVWNCNNYKNGKDDTFFLAFAPEGTKKISYAASLAMEKVPSEEKDRYAGHLSTFSSISVREPSGANILRDIGVKNVNVVLDPVYLLDRNDWDKIADLSDFNPNEKYVLAYWLERGTGIHEYARKLADRLGVKFYSINTAIEGYICGSDKYFWCASPNTFVNLIRNAEAVVTDSFHGVSFSLIYNKPFHLFLRQKKTKGTNSRMEDLLSEIKLTDRIVSYPELLPDQVDFSVSNQTFLEKKALSEAYIKSFIFPNVK